LLPHLIPLFFLNCFHQTISFYFHQIFICDRPLSMFSKPYSRKNSLFKLHRNTKTRRSNFKILATIGLPFLLSTCKVHSQPMVNDQPQESQNIQTSRRNINQDVETDPLDTGFEDLDYWELELQLAQEMVRLNKQKKFLEDNNELRQKLINSDSSLSDRPKLSTWQATEGVVDALIRSGVDQQKSKTVKRAASKSVEQRMLSAKYNRRGSPGAPVAASSTDYSKPRWMRLVYEMKNRKRNRNYRRSQRLL